MEPTIGPFPRMVVGLSLYGDELEPDEVSRRMGCAPTRARRPGERLFDVPPADEGAHAAADVDAEALAASLYTVGAWVLELEGDTFTPADELMERLLGRFPREPAFWGSLDRDFAFQLQVAVEGTACPGFVLGSASLARCAATGASLLVMFDGDARAPAAPPTPGAPPERGA